MNTSSSILQQLLDADVQRFISEHKDDDIRVLSLKKSPNPEWPYASIIDQIKARQKACDKLPHWIECGETIIFPPSTIIEQASSQATAAYKSKLIKGSSFIDLSGGGGVDCLAFAQHFKTGICVEIDEYTASLLTHNIALLSHTPVGIKTSSAEEYAANMPEADLVYIDPQRRNDARKGLYKLEECRPSVLALLPILRQKARVLIIKTSPMLDIMQGIKMLGHVTAVHCVEYRKDCKEVLYILDFQCPAPPPDEVPITAAIIDDEGKAYATLSFNKKQESAATAQLSAPLKYLYEPGAALQKSGGFAIISTHYNLKKLHKNTQLYTSDTLISNFPGRCFEIMDTLPVNRKALPMRKANLTIRNFPSNTETLRRQLNLKEGGDDYLFACTTNDDKKALLYCKKIE